MAHFIVSLRSTRATMADNGRIFLPSNFYQKSSFKYPNALSRCSLRRRPRSFFQKNSNLMGIGTTVNRHRTTHMVDFEQTARANYQRLYAFALQLTRNPSDAEDLTQHAFYRLAVHIQNLKEENKVKSWLYSTLYRKFIDQRRRTVKFPSVQFEETTNHVEENTKRQERLDHQTVKEMLLSLEEHLRIPLSLFYIEHYSYKEISKLLEIPVGTVMSRLHRGKAELYRKLSEAPNQKTGSTDTPTR